MLRRRRPLTVAERLTAPLAPADPAVIAIWDVTHRVAPWLWWPFEVPDPRRPLTAPDHAHFVAHAALGFLAGEMLAQQGPARSAGGRRAAERAISVAATFAIWALSSGAWDRRANRRS